MVAWGSGRRSNWRRRPAHRRERDAQDPFQQELHQPAEPRAGSRHDEPHGGPERWWRRYGPVLDHASILPEQAGAATPA